MTYRLRPATEDDFGFLSRLHAATMKATVTEVWGWDDGFQAAYFRDHFDPSRQQIIVVDGRDIGVLAVERHPDGVFLGNIEIAPEEQGRGLGAAIVRDVMTESFGRGLPVALQVNRINRARRLYERLGFVETGRTETHVQMTASPPAGGRPVVPKGELAVDPKRIVAAGYDRIAERYVEWSGGGSDRRDGFVSLLEGRLPASAAVLELGCGTGALTTARLAKRFAVTGVDISGRSIALARRNVPGATFLHADMAAVRFPAASFDAVAAFYAITHVPREEHAPLLRGIAGWLRPGGLLVATMGAGDAPAEVEEEWLGTPMYFSHYGAETNRQLVRDAGLRLLSARAETTDEDGVPVTFLWVVAEKPGPDESGDEGVVDFGRSGVHEGGSP